MSRELAMRSHSKSMIALWLLLTVGATATAAAQQTPEHEVPPDDVQGSWTIYSKNIDNGETVKKFVHINQDGHHLSGIFAGRISQARSTASLTVTTLSSAPRRAMC
jgi:hypothetical protein